MMGDRASRGIRRRAVRAAATAVAAGVLMAAAAGCQPAPTTTLVVTYRDGHGGSLTYSVTCGPGAAASITPPVAGLAAGRACATVAAETTLLTEGPRTDLVCGQIYYGPQRATVTGNVGEAPVDLSLGRGNTCAEGTWRRLGDLVLRPAPGAR